MGDATEDINDSNLSSVHAANVRPHTSLGFHSDCLNYGSFEPHHCFGSPEPLWRSSSKYIDPGYGYEKCWRSSRARVQGGGDSHFGRDAAPMASGEAKEIRAKVAAYFKLHPPFHLFSSLYEKPASGTSIKESTTDGSHHAMRLYIPGGHEHHFENPGCVVKASTALPVRPTKMWCTTGPQRDPATYRDVITGKMGPLDDFKPPKVTLGPTLLAPAGNLYKDVMDSRFAGPQNMLEPEIPSYSSQLYNEAQDSVYKDYRRNLLNGFSTDHFKNYIYEVKDDHTDILPSNVDF